MIRLKGANNALNANAEQIQQSKPTTSPIKTASNDRFGCYKLKNQQPARQYNEFSNLALRKVNTLVLFVHPKSTAQKLHLYRRNRPEVNISLGDFKWSR